MGLSASDIEAILPSEIIDSIHDKMKSGGVRTVEGAHRRKDGTTFPVEIRLSSLAPAQPDLMIAMVRDITERKRAKEETLRQLEELQRWQEVTLGREDRVRELKHEVNELLARLKEGVRYPSQESESGEQETAKG